MDKKALVLCPPNITAPVNGPKGNLGDRIHQLPAVIAATNRYSKVLVWPQDNFTMGVFRSLNVEFIPGAEITEIIHEVRKQSVDRCFCLFLEPLEIPEGRKDDVKKLEIAYQVSQVFSKDQVSFPQNLNPRGQAPIWKQLLITVDPSLLDSLKWPALPFLYSEESDRIWAKNLVSEITAGKPIMIASPFSGKPEETKKEFWQDLANLFKGEILIPVHSSEIPRAQDLFGAFPNVKIFEADFSKMAALASIPGTHVLGIDGGPMNVLAASRSEGVLAIYSGWPASAWALPNVTPRAPDISAPDALLAMP